MVKLVCDFGGLTAPKELMVGLLTVGVSLVILVPA